MRLSSSASLSLLNLSHSLLLSLYSLLSSLSTLLAIITKLPFVNLSLSLKHTYYKISVFYCLCFVHAPKISTVAHCIYHSQSVHATLLSTLTTGKFVQCILSFTVHTCNSHITLAYTTVQCGARPGMPHPATAAEETYMCEARGL